LKMLMSVMSRLLRLTVALLLVSGLSDIAVAPASAAAFTSVSMSARGTSSPTTVGSTVSIAGGGPVPGAAKPITVYLAKTPGAKTWVTPLEDGDIVATTTSNNFGSWGTSFVVPERRGNSPIGGPVTEGVYDVFLQSGADTFVFSDGSGMRIKPYMDRTPGSAVPGTEITLNGTAFAANEAGITITVALESYPDGVNTTVATGITANSNGSWTATFKLPNREAGTRLLIIARGNNTTNPGLSVSRTIEVLRGVRLIPNRASPGGTVTASLQGFAASSAITFKMDGATLTTVPASPTSTADGRLLATFVVPGGATYGPHEITAGDSSGETATQLTVVRATSLQLTPDGGVNGDTINVTGSGFSPSAPVSFTLDGDTIVTSPPSVTTAADGSFATTFRVSEARAPGYYPLAASDIFGESSSSIFSILSPAPPYKTETGMTHSVTADANKYAFLGGQVVRFLDTSTSDTVSLAEGLGGFDASISYDAAGVSIKAVTGQPVWPLVTSLNTSGGAVTTVSSSQTGSVLNPPQELFKVFPWLTGSKDAAYTVALRFNSITSATGAVVPQQADATRTFRRGDANSSGNVNITDALFIAQYLAGLRDLGETGSTVNPINAATPRNDSPTAGSTVNITDALYIAQMLAGLRDASYNFI